MWIVRLAVGGLFFSVDIAGVKIPLVLDMSRACIGSVTKKWEDVRARSNKECDVAGVAY